MSVAAYVRGLAPRLPREIWLFEVGVLVNSAGSGMVMPFTAIYLHDVRGFGLGTAGLVLAAFAGVSFLATPVAGSVIDALGARRTLVVSLLVLAAGYALLPFVRAPWQAFAVMALAGVGNGAFWPAQSTTLATLAGRELRSRAYAVQRGFFNLGIGIGSLTAGLVATTSEPGTFTIVFEVDALTFVVYAAILGVLRAPDAAAAAARRGGRWPDVLADRVFLVVLGLNVVYVVAGFTLFEIALPLFAKDHLGVGETGIGIAFFVNTVTVVLVQLPVAKLIEGRSRMRALALMTVVWAVAWTVVFLTGSFLTGLAAALAVGAAAVVFGTGECVLGPAQSALAADMAPDHLRGRYLSLVTSSAAAGFMIGPAIVGVALPAAPLALWALAALVLLGAGAGAMALDRRIPQDLRLAAVALPAVEAPGQPAD